MTARKQTAIVGLKVRLREPLRKKLEVAAKKRGVSLNAELVARLEESFMADKLEAAIEKLRRQGEENDLRIERYERLVAATDDEIQKLMAEREKAGK